MQLQRATGDWIGLVVIAAAVIAQVIKALQRGKVEPMPIPGTSLPQRPPRPRPQPVVVRPANPAQAQEAPPPWSRARNAEPAQELPARLKGLFGTPGQPETSGTGIPQPQAALPPEPTEAELYALAQREIATEAATAQASAAIHRPAAARLGLGTLDAWRRAIIAREILDKPVALR
jgi:hypothetical protein